jgi:ribose transport system permease protein
MKRTLRHGMSEESSRSEPANVARRRFALRLPAAVSNVSLLFIWAVLILMFGILRPNTFLTVETFRSVLAEQAITAVMALALIMPVAANAFDLSIAGSMGISIVLSTTFMAKTSIGMPLAIVLTLAVGLCIGSVNAFVIVVLGVNSFIATLGTNSILSALIQWISGGNIVTQGIPNSFINFGRNTLFTIPLFVYYMFAIAAVIWYILDYRKLGRYLYATGSNADAARLAGVRTKNLTTTALLFSASIATLAGLFFVMRIGAGALYAGTPYLLPAFAAAFLGATQFKEGNVNVPGTLIAVYVLATGVKGLELIGAPFWVDDLFNGLALIIAVALAVRSGRQRVMA